MKRKHTFVWAVALSDIHNTKHGWKVGKHYDYCFTWNKPHPEERDQKSKRVYALYPDKKTAMKDKSFRGGDIVVKIKLPLLP